MNLTLDDGDVDIMLVNKHQQILRNWLMLMICYKRKLPSNVLLSERCVSQLLPKFPDLHRNVPANAGKPFNIYDRPLSMIRNRESKKV